MYVCLWCHVGYRGRASKQPQKKGAGRGERCCASSLPPLSLMFLQPVTLLIFFCVSSVSMFLSCLLLYVCLTGRAKVHLAPKGKEGSWKGSRNEPGKEKESEARSCRTWCMQYLRVSFKLTLTTNGVQDSMVKVAPVMGTSWWTWSWFSMPESSHLLAQSSCLCFLIYYRVKSDSGVHMAHLWALAEWILRLRSQKCLAHWDFFFYCTQSGLPVCLQILKNTTGFK